MAEGLRVKLSEQGIAHSEPPNVAFISDNRYNNRKKPWFSNSQTTLLNGIQIQTLGGTGIQELEIESWKSFQNFHALRLAIPVLPELSGGVNEIRHVKEV